MKILIMTVAGCLFFSQCAAGEIIEAFGYLLGARLAAEDVITRREGIGPHDILPKKKARTVKNVQAYTTPESNVIFAIDGLNSFSSMAACETMANTISYFLQKKHADVVDETQPFENSPSEKGISYSDRDGGRNITITCTDHPTETVLSVRYTDVKLAEQAMKDWKEGGEGKEETPAPGLRL
ncbi:MAG: hypothetical protein HY885_03855 [Deltaproteobacteria bacterium]|nr:hypothetical protein [Deltaproteobacteria bacterium]